MGIEQFCKLEWDYKPDDSVRNEGNFLMFLSGRAITGGGVYTEYGNEKRAYAQSRKPLLSLGG
jgi:hypothetical protein